MVTGDKFSPAAFENINSIRIVDAHEPGALGRVGRYRGKPIPYGSATIEVSDRAEKDWSRFDDLLTVVENSIVALREAGADEISILCSLYHDGQCNFAFTQDRLRRIAALKVDLPISCYCDEAE